MENTYKRLGNYIEAVDERNVDGKIKLSQGISNNKYFQNPKQVAVNSTNDNIVRKGYFAYNRATTRNGEKISIAYREGEDCTVSSAYQVFRIKDEQELNPYYLWMWFRRPEFDRYARFKSHGSAHEFFEFNEMCEVYLPVPSIEEQNKIVSEYETLTRSIRHNEQLISKLEETAQTLYRKMFVDGIDKDNLPDGWRMGIIGDLGEIISGATPSTNNPTYWCDNGIPWLSPVDLSKQAIKFIYKGAKDITSLGYKSCSTKMLPKESVLFSSRAPIGLMAISKQELCTNQGFKSIVPKNGIGVAYIYYYLHSIKNQIAEENEGSTFNEVSGQALKAYSAMIPSEDACTKFTQLMQPIFKIQESLEKGKEVLTELQSLILAKMGQ